MKILLPHREVTLDMSLETIERKTVIDNLLAEEIIFHAQTMTVEEYLRYTFNKKPSIVIMDLIAYYLVGKEMEDDLLSTKKLAEMEKGSKRHTTFTSMGAENLQTMGILDNEG